MSRSVMVRLLPDRRVRIHYFVRDDAGIVKNPVRIEQTVLGPMTLGGARGYLACQPRQDSVLPRVHGGVIHPCVHSDDPRAATCPECLGSEAAKKALADYAQTMDTAAYTEGASGGEENGKG